MYKNPKRTKQEVKLWFFYFFDLIIVGSVVMVASQLEFGLSPFMRVIYLVLSFVFGIFLCLRTPKHPLDRNILMIWYLLKMDKNRYYPVEYTPTKKGAKK